jgi:uncharacterized protein
VAENAGRSVGELMPSRYLMISPRLYVSPSGQHARVAYSARTATLLWLTPATASALERGDLSALAEGEADGLAAAGALVPRDAAELTEVLNRMRAAADSAATRRFVIMPTSYCNMACGYCGQVHRKQAVAQARAAATTARVRAAIEDPGVDAVEVGWFGGEPLLGMRVLTQMSEEFIAAADASGTRYRAKMTSNGSLLTPRTIAVLHDRCRLGALTITLDGPAEVHDRRRLMKNGRGTFWSTTRILADALHSGAIPGLKVVIRVNVDRENEDYIFDLIADLALLGLGHPQTELSLTPVHSWGNDVSAIEVEAKRYAAREDEWLRFAHSAGLAVVAVPTTIKQVTCIATTRRGELIDSVGNVFSCTEHPLVPGYAERGRLGQVESLPEPGQRPPGPFDDWYEQVGSGRWPCGNCALLPVCGGRCPKLWSDGHLPCPSMRFDWVAKLDLAAMQAGYRPLASRHADLDRSAPDPRLPQGIRRRARRR